MPLGGWVRTKQRGHVKRSQLTRKNWDAIAEALAFIASGDLAECEHTAEDFEAALAKVNERRKPTNDGD